MRRILLPALHSLTFILPFSATGTELSQWTNGFGMTFSFGAGGLCAEQPVKELKVLRLEFVDVAENGTPVFNTADVTFHKSLELVARWY